MNATIKSLIIPIGRLRAAHVVPLASCVVLLALAAPGWAQSNRSGGWPTTDWIVVDGNATVDAPPPSGERGRLAEKHRKALKAASPWYQKLGFPAPRQLTEGRDLPVESGEAYLGFLKTSPDSPFSHHDSDGEMWLTSNPGFLAEDEPMWQLLKASAVHELYHAIQRGMTRSLDAAARDPDRIELLACQKTGSSHIPSDLNWITEGTAAMVQIRWLEQQSGERWGHPFKGSHRPTWIRQFDQSLSLGWLSSEQRQPRGKGDMASWSCDYGTWYFWYAVGEMIGRNDGEKVAYTRYLYSGPRAWGIEGIGAVDLALQRAAEEYDAIRAYRGGLYDLYPQFVAQYLTEDDFYGNLQTVELGTPDLYETRSLPKGSPLGPVDPRGPIEPLGSRAWRFSIKLPENESSIPYNVRFTLDALHGTDRDDLHLIVDEHVVHRPVDPTAPYADVQRTDLATPAASGAVEYLVRVANVAANAAETEDAMYSLRVEVDGFYGSDVVSSKLTAGDIDRVAGKLPPGFNMRGPQPWSCGSDKTSRALFAVRTPDEAVRDLERSLPQAGRNTENWLDELEIKADKEGKAGNPTMSREELAAFRRQMEGLVADGRNAVQPHVTVAADRERARKTTTLAATFVGQGDDGECQMTLSATLEGSRGGPQVVAGAVDESQYPTDEAPEFSVRVHPTGMLRAMRAGVSTVHPADPRRGDWEVCTMNEAEQQRTRGLASASCPPVVCSAGKLTLEAAEQGRIAGTFEFDVVRWPEDKYADRCGTPLARDKVVGHFNVSSTDDGNEGKGLTDIATSSVPGAPILKLDID